MITIKQWIQFSFCIKYLVLETVRGMENGRSSNIRHILRTFTFLSFNMYNKNFNNIIRKYFISNISSSCSRSWDNMIMMTSPYMFGQKKTNSHCRTMCKSLEFLSHLTIHVTAYT